MEIIHASGLSKKIFNDGSAIVLGISPFNSYFSESNIERLYSWSLQLFKRIFIFVPDIPTKFTLMALGYEEDQAVKKAKRQCKYLFNKISRVADFQSSAVTLINSDWLSSSTIYQEKLSSIYQLFDSNRSFRDECLQCSRMILENYRDKVDNITEEALLVAVRYLLAELPLFISSADIFKENSVVFCYHNNPPFLMRIFKDNLFNLVDSRQGLITVKL